MSAWTLQELRDHHGHDVNIADFAGNITLVCDECNEILLEFHEEDSPFGMVIELGPVPEEVEA